MTGIANSLRGFVQEHGKTVNQEFDAVLASLNPPRPLHVEKLILKSGRKSQVVYEDEECIIIMD